MMVNNRFHFMHIQSFGQFDKIEYIGIVFNKF